jgi:hypothetical protein
MLEYYTGPIQLFDLSIGNTNIKVTPHYDKLEYSGSFYEPFPMELLVEGTKCFLQCADMPTAITVEVLGKLSTQEVVGKMYVGSIYPDYSLENICLRQVIDTMFDITLSPTEIPFKWEITKCVSKKEK